MFVAVKAQKPLPLGGVAGDDTHIWNHDLEVIDELLCDEELIETLWSSARQNAPGAAGRGRRRMPFNRVLRTAVLKHVKNWSWRQLWSELQRNLDHRAFTQFFEEATGKPETLCRNIAAVDADAIRRLNERLCNRARELGVIHGRMVRQDTTVCETNIHYPTDSRLLQDGVRVLQRVVKRAEELVPALGKLRDRSKSVRNRVLEIARAARGRGEVPRQKLQRSYRSLLRSVRPVVTAAERVARRLAEGKMTRSLGLVDSLVAEALKDEIDTMAPRVERVIRQKRARGSAAASPTTPTSS